MLTQPARTTLPPPGEPCWLSTTAGLCRPEPTSWMHMGSSFLSSLACSQMETLQPSVRYRPWCLTLERGWRCTYKAENSSLHSFWMRTKPGCCSHRSANLLAPSLSSPGVLPGADAALAQALSGHAGLQDTEGSVLVYFTRLGPLGSPMECGCLSVLVLVLPHCWLWGSAERQRVGDLGTRDWR